jgi:hypothetical protein
MPRAFVTRQAEGEESMDHPTTRRENTSRTTAQYTLVLGDVGHPPLVRLGTHEVPLHEIARRRRLVAGASLTGAGESLQVGPTHQHGHGVVPHDDAWTHGEFRVDP